MRHKVERQQRLDHKKFPKCVDPLKISWYPFQKWIPTSQNGFVRFDTSGARTPILEAISPRWRIHAASLAHKGIRMNPYSEVAEDFYINMQLQTATDLPQQREALVHFFEQVQRRYPKMRNLLTREKELFLEEDKDGGNYRWASADLRRLCSGYVNPTLSKRRCSYIAMFWRLLRIHFR